MAEFERVCARLITVDRGRSEVRREHEYVGAGTGIEDIVRSADQARGGGASGERLITQMPATTSAPPTFSAGPDPLAMLSRKKLFPTSVRLVDPAASITVVAGTPITPSPFKSWWKLVSSVSNT